MAYELHLLKLILAATTSLQDSPFDRLARVVNILASLEADKLLERGIGVSITKQQIRSFAGGIERRIAAKAFAQMENSGLYEFQGKKLVVCFEEERV